ncbi:D-ribitol-5-phosphate cytidylyltransferase-like [Glandiceps talaboti]
MEMEFTTYAVLPAAGTGERMGLQTPKQYCEVLGRPLITYTLQRFESIPWIGTVVVAVSQERLEFLQNQVKKYNLTKVLVIEGAETRHRSIKKCLKVVNDLDKPDVIIIHDAVRPFADEDILSQVSKAAHNHGAAGAIQPLVSTVIAPTEDGFLDHSLVRSKYTASHTPQAFRYDVIHEAYTEISEEDLDHGTECLQLALKYTSTRAKLVSATGDIWKVTYRRDLYTAEGLAKELNSVAIVTSDSTLMTQQIEQQLRCKGLQMLSVYSKVDDVIETVNSVVVCTNSSLEEVSNTVQQIFAKMQTQIQYGGSVVIVVSHSNPDCKVYLKSRELCKKLSEQGRSGGLCVNIVIINKEESGSSNTEAANMITELVFHRNLAFSGQVFQLP